MKRKKGLKVISILTCISILVTQLPTFFVSVSAESTKTKLEHDRDLMITRAPYKSYGQLLQDYEMTLVDTWNPSIVGNELGIPINPKDYDGFHTNLNSSFETNRTTMGWYDPAIGSYNNDSGLLYNNLLKPIWGEINLLEVGQITESDITGDIDINFQLITDPSKKCPKIWNNLIEQGQLLTKGRTFAGGITYDIKEENLPTVTFGDLKLEYNGSALLRGEAKTTNATNLNFLAPSNYKEGYPSGYAGENRYFRNTEFEIIDTVDPYITKASADGHYLSLTFNEPIRYSNKSSSTYYIGKYEPYVMNEDNVKLPVSILGFKDDSKTIVMHVDVKDYYKNDKDFIVSYFGFGKEFDDYVTIYGSDNLGGLTSYSTKGGKSPICDYAGNTVGQFDVTGKVTIVSSSPKGVSFNINGDMLGANTVVKDGEWPADTDKSQIFAGVGDVLNFSIEVDSAGGNKCLMFERHDYSDIYSQANIVYLTLNIKDKNGDNVKIPLKSTRNGIREGGIVDDDSSKQEIYDATTGILEFWPLTFEEGMHLDEGEDYIKAISINSSNDVIDANGNPITSQVFGSDMGCSKKIKIDTTAPVLEDDVTYTVNNNTLTVIPIITDAGSGLDGKSVSLSIYGDIYKGTNKEPIPVQYTIDGKTVNTTISDNPDSFGYFTMPMSEAYKNTMQCPITFTDTENYTINNVKVVVKTEDWAGNITTSERLLKDYKIDKNAPEISVISSNISYTNDTATFDGVFKVDDVDLSYATALYAWGDESFVNSEIDENNLIKISKTYTDFENVDEFLKIKVTDKNGNTSDVYEHEVKFDTSKAPILYETEGNLYEPSLKPVIKVSAPEDRADGTKAYTRATLSFNGKKYVRIITGDEKDVSLFDFTGEWNVVSIEGGQYTAFYPLSGADISKKYSDVNVTLESAYADLTPDELKSVELDASTGYIKIDLGNVKFAYSQNDTYQLQNKEIKLDGTTVSDLDVIGKTLAGYSFKFDIANIAMPSWGVSEVDFNNSFIQLLYQSDYGVNETEFVKVPLNNSIEQSFNAPNKEYQTGIYTLEVTIQGKNGKVYTDTFDSFIVDNEKVTNSGLWSYTYGFATPNGYWIDEPDCISDEGKTAVTNPFNFVRMLPDIAIAGASNVEGHYAILANGEKVNVTSDDYRNELGTGIKYRIDSYADSNLRISICADKKSTNLDKAGNYEKIEFWGYNADGTKSDVYTYNEDFYDSYHGDRAGATISVSQILENINLTAVNNAYTINYQMTLENGNTSTVKVFTVEVPPLEQLPSAELEYSNIKTTTLENGEERLVSVDVEVKNLSCGYSNLTVYRAYKDLNMSNSFMLEEYTGPITYSAQDLKANIHSNATGDYGVENIPVNWYHTLKELFLVVDEYGATTTLTPVFDGVCDDYQFGANEKDKMLYTFLESELFLNEDLVISTTTGTPSEAVANDLDDINASYIFNINPENIDVDSSSITIGDKTFGLFKARTGVKDTSFIGTQIVDLGNDTNDLFMKFAYPIDKAKADANQSMTFDFTLNAVGKYSGNHDYANTSVNSIPYKAQLVNKTENGVVYFNTYAAVSGNPYDYKYTIPTNCHTTLSDIEATDLYGVTHKFDAVVNAPSKPTVTVDEVNPTIDPVTLVFKHDSNMSISCETFGTATGDDFIIKGNNTEEVTVIAKNNIKITVNDSTGEVGYYDVTNIDVISLEIEKNKVIVPEAQVSVYPAGFDETDTEITGPLTITLKDSETGEQLFDAQGDEISYTFDPELEDYTDNYTFPSGSYFNYIGATGEEFTVDLSDDFGITLAIKDTTSPSVQITGKISDGASQIIAKEFVFNHLNTNEDEGHPTLPSNPLGYTEEASMDAFIAELGWANQYIFKYDIADKTETNVFIKDGIITSLPSDYNSTSDDIEGVDLNIISKNITVDTSCEFTLFVEDNNKNITFIPFDVTVSQNDFKVTPTVKINDTYDALKLYITAPQGVTDFKVTNTGAEIETLNNGFKGSYYLTFTNNTKDVEVNYSFKCNGLSFTGSTTCDVTGLGETSYDISWSFNKNETQTNKDVVATLSFNGNVENVKFMRRYPSVKAEVKYQQIILTFTDNTPEQIADITIRLSNGQTTVLRNIQIPAVTNIDKTLPDVTYKTELSENGKSVKITFTSENGMVYNSKGVYSDTFTETVKSNSIYYYSFTDMAGNILVKKVDVYEIIDEDLVLQFSTDNSNYVSDPSTLKFNVDEPFYVKSNRDCSIIFNDQKAFNIVKNTATRIMMDYAENESPSIFAQDKYGSYYYQFSSIKAKDTKKPTITIINDEISAKTSTSLEELREMLLANVAVVDNMDRPSDITLKLDVSAPVSAGQLSYTYTATDSSQNTATLTSSITIYDENAPIPTLNGTVMERNSSLTISKDNQILLANIATGESFSVVVKAGIKTVAQMKIGATTIVYNQTDNTPINLQLTKSGFYTVCIKTRDRDFYRLTVRVE